MLSDQRALTITNTSSNNLEEILIDQDDHDDGDQSPIIRDIHALTPPARGPRWETTGRSSSLASVASSENFTSMSREFNALVLAGSTIGTDPHEPGSSNLDRIREEDNNINNPQEETNPLAIVPDNNPLRSPQGGGRDHRLALSNSNSNSNYDNNGSGVSVQSVKKEEVESKINAWQNAKIAKINNRFKREDAVINGWEGEQVQKASSWMKKIERKLEEKRAKAHEKMQNEIAKAHRKAEERRASSEAKRGTKVARVLEVANLMRAVGRAPVKRSFF
ncbi:hypothetical protein PHJA_001113200 [Phtheirospermum japonicum]|uniref:Remorin C-terminal domain-containing protein n=1 Tax=Phtheirospermum japonicum TaxID=374723 RepID=A0A830BZW9_9LAMI|nr:hypothetical protein PHJA_001113200 [Phtheirospermum japonicum]